MKFISTRELRNRPGHVRKLAQQQDLVLTANGKPVAIVLGVKEDELEETAFVVRQVKAQRALARMRRIAAERGLDRLSPAQVDDRIRRAKPRRKSA